MSEKRPPATFKERAFDRVRADHAQETAEDYTELILELGGDACVRQKELARRVGVSHVTVVRVIARLERDGLVERVRGEGVRLTRRGRLVAEGSRRRHQLVASFLCWLGVPPDIAAADAEGIEHHVSEATLKRMRDAVEQNRR